MPSAAYSLIRQAILDKDIVTAMYDGHLREMRPHTLGYKHGQEHALFYQFGGTSRSGLAPAGSAQNWRCVFVGRLTQVAVRKGPWQSAGNHSRPQTCVDEIDVEVSY